MITGMPARGRRGVPAAPPAPPPATMTRSCLRFKSFSLLSTETITFVRAEEKLAPHTPDRSLPPCGGGLGRGVAAGKNVANSAHLTTPTPVPSPQGGGERKSRRARHSMDDIRKGRRAPFTWRPLPSLEKPRVETRTAG